MKYTFLKYICAFALALLACSHSHAQHYAAVNERMHDELSKIQIERLAGDSLTTSFLIGIPHRVPTHYHAAHSEHVYVLQGSGRMWLGGDTLMIGPGDYVFIPAQTTHGVEVIGDEVLKVISIQAPDFDGSDRVMVPD